MRAMRKRGLSWPNALWEYCEGLRDNDNLSYPAIEKELTLLASTDDRKSKEWELARKFGLTNSIPHKDTIRHNVDRLKKPRLTSQEAEYESSEHPRQGLPSGDFQRLERILSDMWIPDPDEVPLNLFQYGSNIHVEQIQGKSFRWEYCEDGREGLVWVDHCDDSWLTQEVLPILDERLRGELNANWRELQTRVFGYIYKALEYSGYQYHSNVSDVLWAEQSGTSLNKDHPMVEHALHLINEAQWLNNQVGQFKQRLLNAVRALQ